MATASGVAGARAEGKCTSTANRDGRGAHGRLAASARRDHFLTLLGAPSQVTAQVMDQQHPRHARLSIWGAFCGEVSGASSCLRCSLDARRPLRANYRSLPRRRRRRDDSARPTPGEIKEQGLGAWHKAGGGVLHRGLRRIFGLKCSKPAPALGMQKITQITRAHTCCKMWPKASPK